MDILGIQLVGIAFGLIFLYLTFINKKRNELNLWESLFWIIIWLALIAISFYPSMLNFVVIDILKVYRTLDFLTIASFLIIFGVLFYIFIITKKTEQRMEKLVRSLAVKNAKDKTK